MYCKRHFLQESTFYSKPTDSHLYLSPSSCHPKHVFKAIPLGVATRLKRNCSEEIFLAKTTAEYKGYLVNQGYPSKLVNDQFSKASAISRNDLLRTRGKEAKKLFPFSNFVYILMYPLFLAVA